MAGNCTNTMQFIEDFNNIKEYIDHLKDIASTQFYNYFNSKISDGQNTLFDIHSPAIIKEVYQIELLSDLTDKLPGFHFTINIRNHPTGKSNSTLQFDVVSDERRVAIHCDDSSYISSSQRRYLTELEYTLTIAYRLTLLSDALLNIQNALKPLFDTYVAVFSGRSIYESLDENTDLIERLRSSKVDERLIHRANAILADFQIDSSYSIESLLEHAYNNHVQGRLIQRTWQQRAISFIARKVDDKVQLNSSLSHFIYPKFEFPKNATSNKLQNNISKLERHLWGDSLSQILDEFKRYSQKLLHEPRPSRNEMFQSNETADKLLSDLRQQMAEQKSTLESLRAKRFEHELQRTHLQLLLQLEHFVYMNIMLNSSVANKRCVEKFTALYQELSAIAGHLQDEEYTYSHTDLLRAEKIIEILSSFRNMNLSFEKPSFLEQVLALIHRIIPFFQEYFIKCENHSALKKAESILESIILISREASDETDHPTEDPSPHYKPA